VLRWGHTRCTHQHAISANATIIMKIVKLNHRLRNWKLHSVNTICWAL